MEFTREMFFNWDELDKAKVVSMITQNPNQWERILEFIGDEMRDDLDFEYEKKWLKEKYKHDMRELYEKYGYDLDTDEK